MIKSPLRYPGGKSRAVLQIDDHSPLHFDEYREPFVGGGSFFIYLRQMRPNVKIWINDLNPEVVCFWRALQDDATKLAVECQRIKRVTQNGELLFRELVATKIDTLTIFERAVRFFVLNRITFSGTVESGGYSDKAFHARFTESSIQRLIAMSSIMDGVRITQLDYADLLNAPSGSKTFIFLDPPYLSATSSKLYGRNGVLHTGFDHARFATEVKSCAHDWLITYDDVPEIRDAFSFAYQDTWQLQYGMNNYKQGKAEVGNELFISNYEFATTKQLELL